MNLIMFCLLLPILSLFFWNKASQFKNDELASSIETIRSSLKARGSSLLANLALTTNQAIASFDFTNLNLMVRQVTLNDADIQYCLVTDQQGVTVAHNQQARVGSRSDDDFSAQVATLMGSDFPKRSDSHNGIPVTFLHETNNPNSGIMEAVTPVYSGSLLWGALRCGYSLQGLQQQIKHIETKWLQEKNRFTAVFAIIVVCFLLIGITVSLYFTHYFSRAVKILNDSVNEVANGNLQTRIPAKHLLCTEFSSLADAINQMTSNLFSSRLQLDKYSNSLKTLVAERTEELEIANKELESFSYSVSHDLRAPLRSIDGFSRMLEEDYHGKLDAEGNDCLRRVRKNTQHMQKLIDSLLTLSRVTRSPLRREDINLGQYAKEKIEQLQTDDPRRDVQVTIAENLNTHSDPNLTKAVVDNLISNAWKYTAKTEHAIIEFGQVIQDGKPVFYVRDNGAGFDMTQSDKLFGAFQRLHKEEDFAGTGIGLATVQRIINRLGGKIWAQAEINKGAIFYFTIPA